MSNRTMSTDVWLSLIENELIRAEALNYNNLKSVNYIHYSLKDVFDDFFNKTRGEENGFWNSLCYNIPKLRKPIHIDDVVINTITQKEFDIVTAYYNLKWVDKYTWDTYKNDTCVDSTKTQYTYKKIKKTILTYDEWLNKIGAVYTQFNLIINNNNKKDEYSKNENTVEQNNRREKQGRETIPFRGYQRQPGSGHKVEQTSAISFRERRGQSVGELKYPRRYSSISGL